MMKVSKEQVAKNRLAILDTAATLFAEHGFGAVSLNEVMEGAGLTNGAFYRHFASKDDLVAKACAHAVAPAGEGAQMPLSEYCAGYLTPLHRDNRAEGCQFAALGSEAALQPIEVRHEMTEGLRSMIDRLARTVDNEDAATRRERAMSSFSTLLGGLVLARMCDDPELSDEILAANRAMLTKPEPSGHEQAGQRQGGKAAETD